MYREAAPSFVVWAWKDSYESRQNMYAKIEEAEASTVATEGLHLGEPKICVRHTRG